MEIDSTPVPPPQEYSDCSQADIDTTRSESSMNFLNYLNTLDAHDNAMDSSSSSSPASRHFGGIGGANSSTSACCTGASATTSYGHVDDSKALDRPINLNERFVTVLDQLDARVEKFRKDALGLQEKRDFLLMSIDLIKSHDMLHSMMDCERDEISCYIQRVNSRLSTVELNVRTVRDRSQEDSLSQINELIDMMITMNDPVMARQRCQQYLNACCSAAEAGGGLEAGACISSLPVMSEGGIDIDAGPVDKKFEGTLLGCTLDDQKNIKKRLQALMGYLNKQIIQN